MVWIFEIDHLAIRLFVFTNIYRDCAKFFQVNFVSVFEYILQKKCLLKIIWFPALIWLNMYVLVNKYQVQHDIIIKFTAKSIVISRNFRVCKFCEKAQFPPHSFGRIPRNYAETVPFNKISTPGNQVNLRFFTQCLLHRLLEFKLNICPVVLGAAI